MKIFFLTPRVPYPIDKGDKLRAYYQIKYLSEEHEIFLFALDENCEYNHKNNPLKNLCKKVEIVYLSKFEIVNNLFRGLFKKIPFQTSYYYSAKTKKKIEAAINEFEPDIIYCQLIRAAEFVKEIKSVPKIIDYVDVISKGLERRMAKSSIIWRLIFKIEYLRACKYEEEVFENFDKSIIITNEDRNLLPFAGKDSVAVIPNGIDTDFFVPAESEKKYDLFFSGNLSYPPNVDAAKFIVYEIVPILKKVYPSIKVLIAGASPKKELLELASENIEVKGWVDDIREYYSQTKIFLAPMQIGTGLQNKILQAMAMKIPCVVSELTMKGIANGGKDAAPVAKTPQDYVDSIINLLTDKEYYNTIAQQGHDFVHKKYSWKEIIDNLKTILDYAARNKN